MTLCAPLPKLEKQARWEMVATDTQSASTHDGWSYSSANDEHIRARKQLWMAQVCWRLPPLPKKKIKKHGRCIKEKVGGGGR